MIYLFYGTRVRQSSADDRVRRRRYLERGSGDVCLLPRGHDAPRRLHEGRVVKNYVTRNDVKIRKIPPTIENCTVGKFIRLMIC